MTRVPPVEADLRSRGFARIAGVDEAGRGPIAGPVVAAAVILAPDTDLSGIDDSKKLSATAREAAYARIVADAMAWAVGIAEPDEIDRINILRATHEAMRRAVDALAPAADAVIVDGLAVPRLHPVCANLVKGDALCTAIGAASIVAKVTRDRLMVAYDSEWPGYGFAGHKGYPAPSHLAALARLGPCPIHRRTFGPVAQQTLVFDP